ncbi:TrkH-domain-containing protein [Hortaea werneckii]|nr:TrkH-domain-containing protein [Hortaea werneckii]KAI7102510.1 TrkH-domain-containing protein [Hortaea werneckii]KAI7242865.1 TrkH-domain-containing protein [Hortaea werneckii]KAI7292704.1 TrkH-domain-containing protein [Hortaea werneckii]KAI7379365.1 TrkH-domain-containing protein [Hortaea werneckii]
MALKQTLSRYLNAWPLRAIRQQLPPLNFITIHYLYFTLTCLAFALVFWGSSTPFKKVTFIDSLFLTISAMTLAGLNTVNLSELNTFQQFLLFILIMLGSAIWVSGFVVLVRKHAFEKKFEDMVARAREKRGRSRSRSRIGRVWTRRASETAENDEERNELHDRQGSDESESKVTPEDQQGTEPQMYSALDGVRERSQTPPARRGGPEMNGISSITGQPVPLSDDDESKISRDRSRIAFRDDVRFSPRAGPQPKELRRRSSNIFSMNGVGARPMRSLAVSTSVGDPLPRIPLQRAKTDGKYDISRYFESAAGWVSRNSQFHGLSQDEREKLGGCEYRALYFLAWLVPAYFVMWQLLGALGCASWVAYHAREKAEQNGLNPWWVGAFNAVSAFNNSGMSLLDANMIAFQRSYYMLLTMGLLILAGNTCFPIFLRFIIWSMWKAIENAFAAERWFKGEQWDERRRTLRFLLDHPRRCFTNLFPSQHTWWLLLSVITLNVVDWAAFEILNINNKKLESGLETRYRVIDGLFQAFAVRSGGFYVVSIPTLRISLQVLYVVMMYISVYPVVITMRNSNVYEERSLGIYADDEDEEQDPDAAGGEKTNSHSEPARSSGFLLRRAKTIRDHFIAGGAAAATQESNGHFVRQQLRAQLAHDAWWIVLALFLIMIIESSSFDKNPVVYSVFNFIFEVVSAYGCVGISVGIPWNFYSFCGSWHTLSKLILCAVMLRGRHRGLPVAIDKAVLIPGEKHWAAEEEDGRIRLARTMSRGRGAEIV